MEMHQVRYFLSASKTLNFTRAAEQCHVSQPALTAAIKPAAPPPTTTVSTFSFMRGCLLPERCE